MGLIATALSQLLGFGLEQADDFIDRKIESGQLEEAAEATKFYIQSAEERVNSLREGQGMTPIPTTPQSTIDAFARMQSVERDPNQRNVNVQNFNDQGFFGLAERDAETLQKRQQGADTTAFNLIEEGTGGTGSRMERLGQEFNIDPAEVNRQQIEREKAARRFETDQRVEETKRESDIPGRVSRGGAGGGGRDDKLKPFNQTGLEAVVAEWGLANDPSLIDQDATAQAGFAGKGTILSAKGQRIVADGGRFKDPLRQTQFLNKRLGSNFGLPSAEGSPTATSDDTQDEIDNVKITLEKELEEIEKIPDPQTKKVFKAVSGALRSGVEMTQERAEGARSKLLATPDAGLTPQQKALKKKFLESLGFGTSKKEKGR